MTMDEEEVGKEEIESGFWSLVIIYKSRDNKE